MVTAISGDIGNGILKILKRTECVLFGCDVYPVAVGMDLVSKFWQCKYAVDINYVEEILKFCKDNNIKYLIPTNEREIEVIGKSREKFSQAGIKLMIQSQNVLEICLDKFRTMQFLEELGIRVPKTYLSVNDIPKKILKKEYERYICKGRKSNGSRDIQIFESREDILAVGEDQLENNVIQEYIEGNEYTVGIFKMASYANVICFRRQVKDGYSHIVELISNDQMEALARKIADELHVEGYINIQLREKEGKYYVFEINPRISGTVGFRDKLGFTDVLWWLDLIDGKLIWTDYSCQYKEVIGIRELCEKFLALK
ncbi:MAG: ATP-grasp domain-containing protein [Ruminococcus flavefaciens]|nr:ATP-grasp domain-containing protein [Ruminococcus flavefaciens]